MSYSLWRSLHSGLAPASAAAKGLKFKTVISLRMFCGNMPHDERVMGHAANLLP